MKGNGSSGQQLALKEIILLPGGEWAPRSPGWTLIRVHRGAGYWMHPRLNQDLAENSVLVLSHQVKGLIRSSQLGELSLQFFFVQPENLSGVVTLKEQQILKEAAQKEGLAVRLLPATEPVAEDFRRLCAERDQTGARARVQRLELFVRLFERELAARSTEPAVEYCAKDRLEMLIEQMPAADLLELEFCDLAAQVGCSPRHLGRVFQDVMGTSFREKQTEARLGRAKELLANSTSKIVEVALESGYQSLSLFNLMFKRRFGFTPSQWRHQPVRREALRRARS